MLSNTMLQGIPEIDLGIEAKIRNIEETETAKLKLLKEAVQQKKTLEEATTARQDIVKDLGYNYVRHNRFKIDNTTELGTGKLKRPPTDIIPVVQEDTPKWVLMEKTPGGKHNERALGVFEHTPIDRPGSMKVPPTDEGRANVVNRPNTAKLL